MRNSKENRTKSLFLICPTDGLEVDIIDSFQKDVYFYTLLGACFDSSYSTQSTLIDLITDKGINSIILVAAKTNIFLKIRTENGDLPKYLPKNFSMSIYSNYDLIAAKHLMKQKNKMLRSPLLGQFLIDKNISISGYVFRSLERTFHSADCIKEKNFWGMNINLN